MTQIETLTPIENAVWISRERIYANPNQPRKSFAAGELEELRESIREHGILQPIVVRNEPSRYDGRPYKIVSGERRWQASDGVLDVVPCIISGVDAKEAQVLALVENLQRVDLTPIEEARGIADLMEAEGLSQNATSKRLNKHINWVRNRLGLLKTGADVQEVAAVAPDKMSSLLEIDTVTDDSDTRRDLLEMARRGESHAAIMQRVDAYRQNQRIQAQSRRAPDSETQSRLVEQGRSGGGQMSRGRMVTGTPRDETRAQIEAALSEIERHTKTLQAWAAKADRKYLQERIEPRVARVRRELRGIGD